MDTARIEAFLRDMHALLKKHDAVIFGDAAFKDGFSLRVGGFDFESIDGDRGSVLVDTKGGIRLGVCFEHNGEHFTGTGVTDREG